MIYAAESDHHVHKTVRSLLRTLGLVTVLAFELVSVYVLPPDTCVDAADTTARCDVQQSASPS